MIIYDYHDSWFISYLASTYWQIMGINDSRGNTVTLWSKTSRGLVEFSTICDHAWKSCDWPWKANSYSSCTSTWNALTQTTRVHWPVFDCIVSYVGLNLRGWSSFPFRVYPPMFEYQNSVLPNSRTKFHTFFRLSSGPPSAKSTKFCHSSSVFWCEDEMLCLALITHTETGSANAIKGPAQIVTHRRHTPENLWRTCISLTHCHGDVNEILRIH